VEPGAGVEPATY